MEQWKEHPDYPLYEVSTEGRVRSWRGPHGRRKAAYMMRLGTYQKGYPCATLWDGKKRIMRKVHRLVLETFVGKRPHNRVCRHLNGNPQDNRLKNLAWGTQRKNCEDILRHRGITEEDQHAAMHMYIRGCDVQPLADTLGVVPATILGWVTSLRNE